MGSDGIGTRRGEKGAERTSDKDEKDGANWCKRSKYDPRPRRKTFGETVPTDGERKRRYVIPSSRGRAKRTQR